MGSTETKTFYFTTKEHVPELAIEFYNFCKRSGMTVRLLWPQLCLE